MQDGRVEEGRDGLHPRRFRVAHQVGLEVGLVLGKGQVAPCGHTHMHPPDVAHHTQYVSWLEASWCEMARPEFKGKVSIPIVSGSPRGRGGNLRAKFFSPIGHESTWDCAWVWTKTIAFGVPGARK